MELKIYRLESGTDGTFGVLAIDGKVFCCTLELPWKDNAKEISCIPPGKYQVKIKRSPKFGIVPEVLNVPDRSDILMHPGNVIADVKGCIMIGYRFGVIGKARGLFDSRLAMGDFSSYFTVAKTLSLEIVNA